MAAKTQKNSRSASKASDAKQQTGGDAAPEPKVEEQERELVAPEDPAAQDEASQPADAKRLAHRRASHEQAKKQATVVCPVCAYEFEPGAPRL